MGENYWWCTNCKREVDPLQVTYEEYHDNCGCKLKWITVEDYGLKQQQKLISSLEQQLREADIILRIALNLLNDGIHIYPKANTHLLIKEYFAAKEKE